MRPTKRTPRTRAFAARTSAALTAGLALLVGLALVFIARDLRLQARLQGRLPVELALPMHAPRDWNETGHAVPRTTLYIRNSAKALAALFDRLGYHLADGRPPGDVPRVYVTALPPDVEELPSVAERKSVFLRSLLPLVLEANENLRAERNRLRKVLYRLNAGMTLSDVEAQWLAGRYEHYGVPPGKPRLLLRGLDEVPPSLALAQAATESGWGTSRFVQEGNALFGMWTWSADVPGIVPLERTEAARHRIRAFETLSQSVRVYVHTLNTHWAYADFRGLRESLRRRGRTPEGLVLVQGMSRYAETRQDYIAGLRSLIRANALSRLDRAALDPSGYLAAVAVDGTLLAFQDPGR